MRRVSSTFLTQRQLLSNFTFKPVRIFKLCFSLLEQLVESMILCDEYLSQKATQFLTQYAISSCF